MENKLKTISARIINFHELIQKFIANHDITPGSRKTYVSALRQFFWWFEQQNIENPTRETILAFKESLDLKGLRPFTRSAYLVAVRKFFEWAEGLKLYPNIAKGIKGAKRSVKNHHKDSLSLDQIKRLIQVIPRNTLQGVRDFALINLLIRTGLRLIEISRADIGDLQIENDEALLWVRGKGRDGKDDFVVLTEETLEPILFYMRQRKIKDQKEPLFASLSDRNYGKRITTFSLSRLIKGYLRRAGLNSRRLSAHSLRHTFGVLSIQSGASLYEVQLAMRHMAPTTTEVYLGDIEQQKRREAAPEKRLSELLAERGIK
ncbi:MAG: tyrosine-type recombinase/integrase [Candidatus Babeliaceae bacterium]